jgi:type II secretory pathway component PulF
MNTSSAFGQRGLIHSLRSISSRRTTRLSVREQAYVAKRLSFLLHSGITLRESISLLRDHAERERHRALFTKMSADIDHGQYLSQSMLRLTPAYSDLMVSMVNVGEHSGTLPDSLTYVADILTKQYELQKKVRSALIYPLFISCVTLVMTLGLTVYVFPKIAPIFQSFDIALPLSTRILLYLSDAFTQYGIACAVVMVCLVMCSTWMMQHSRRVQIMVDRYCIYIPYVRTWIIAYNTSRLCRTLGVLLASGTTLSDALEITETSIRNTYYKSILTDVSRGVRHGKKMSSLLLPHSRDVVDLLPSMVSVGESSGTLSQSLRYVADMTDTEIDDMAKNLTTMIEPVLLVIMGALVGTIALSIIIPIYEITTSLDGQ